MHQSGLVQDSSSLCENRRSDLTYMSLPSLFYNIYDYTHTVNMGFSLSALGYS